MSWVATGVAVGSAALGAYSQGEQQKAQNKATRSSMLANAAAMEYSPWTGMGKEMIQAGPQGTGADIATAGLQSGLQGYMFGKQFGGGTTPKKPMMNAGLDQKYRPPGSGGFDPSRIA